MLSRADVTAVRGILVQSHMARAAWQHVRRVYRVGAHLLRARRRINSSLHWFATHPAVPISSERHRLPPRIARCSQHRVPPTHRTPLFALHRVPPSTPARRKGNPVGRPTPTSAVQPRVAPQHTTFAHIESIITAHLSAAEPPGEPLYDSSRERRRSDSHQQSSVPDTVKFPRQRQCSRHPPDRGT